MAASDVTKNAQKIHSNFPRQQANGKKSPDVHFIRWVQAVSPSGTKGSSNHVRKAQVKMMCEAKGQTDTGINEVI